MASGEEDNREPREFETGEKIFFATQNGTGDGKSPDSPMDIRRAFSELPDDSTLYLLEDINLGTNPSVSQSVTIIGAGGNNGWGKVTVTSSSQTYVVRFTQSSKSYTISNVIIDGQGQRTGISANGTLILEDCIIQNGISTSTSYGGGGIEISSSYTTVTLTGCQIKNCSATKDGGGIYSAGTLNLNNCQIINCSSTEKGGGVATGNGATIKLINSTISGCTGGGLYLNQPGNVTIEGSTITDCGNNIYVSTSSEPNIITRKVTPEDTVSSLGIF